MRLFFALWPPREAAEAMHSWALRAHRATGGSVVPAPNIHLTLAFLGEIEEQRVAELKILAVESAPFSLWIERARCWARNRIVWAGPNEIPGPLKFLVVRLVDQLAARNFRTEKRSFAAHVTLIRKAREAQLLPPLPVVDWPVGEMALVRSALSAEGSHYQVLKRYSFG